MPREQSKLCNTGVFTIGIFSAEIQAFCAGSTIMTNLSEIFGISANNVKDSHGLKRHSIELKAYFLQVEGAFFFFFSGVQINKSQESSASGASGRRP